MIYELKSDKSISTDFELSASVTKTPNIGAYISHKYVSFVSVFIIPAN
jgi:hypothetical protein